MPFNTVMGGMIPDMPVLTNQKLESASCHHAGVQVMQLKGQAQRAPFLQGRPLFRDARSMTVFMHLQCRLCKC